MLGAPAMDRMSPSSAISTTPAVARVCEVGRLYAGQYLVKAVLGVGGMAEVYLVEQQTLRADFALKVLRRELQQRPDMVQRFRSESRALWELSHPSFVRVHHAGDDPALGPFMIMEVLRGKTLAQTLRKNRYIEVGHALSIAIEIADACEAMHRLGIIHRDLKPENIFLTLEPEKRHGLKLLDLGAAKIAKYGAPATAEDRQIGTGKYMSPEQIRGQELGPASDVYALGLIIFEMVSGTPVFGVNHPNPTHLDYQVWHVNAQPERLSARFADAPPGLDEVLWQGMQKNPAHRFQTMAAFASALREILSARSAARLKGGTVQMDAASMGEEQRLIEALMAPSTDGKWSYPSDAVTNAAETREVETRRSEPAPGASAPFTSAPAALPLATMESARLGLPAKSPAHSAASSLVAPTEGAQPMAELGDLLPAAHRPRPPATQAMVTPAQWPAVVPQSAAAGWSGAPVVVPPAPPTSGHRSRRGSSGVVIVAVVLAVVAIVGFLLLRASGRL